MLLWGWLAIAAVGSYMFFRGGSSKIGADSGEINRGITSIDSTRAPEDLKVRLRFAFKESMTRQPPASPENIQKFAKLLDGIGAAEAARLARLRMV